ncbi:hypothetical protein [Microvirga sp. CF3016]|uniref:hypothetical protein n=1 Tax=Microvirga sp. CF3016 TaxID=3110181 RepID=UPI002E76E26C|nr:hypothetical protein [Microvirga sp. CF3016]MEE1610338.1 hypothetical protein [Microvirga sp. CF3016]
MTSLSSSEFHREKLEPECVAEMRGMVEGSALSLRQIARTLGVSAGTVSRYARQEGWQRPAGPTPPPEGDTPAPQAEEPDALPPAPAPPPGRRETPPAGRREQIVDRLWTLAERHAQILETQPIERAERSLQPLARLTRTLGEIDKHARPPLPAHEYEKEYAIDAPKPRRTLHELRDELAAHLERIQREEGYGWEVREWWFEGGGGI